MPKSSSFTVPSAVTRMLDGLRSRWTIRFAWACATASEHLEEEPESGVDRRDAAVAVPVDPLALDVLQDQ